MSTAVLIALLVLTVMDAVASQGHYRTTIVRESVYLGYWVLDQDWDWG